MCHPILPLIALVLLSIAPGARSEDPTVTDVTAFQELGKTTVRISYTLSHPNGTAQEADVRLELSADNGVTWTVPVVNATGTGRVSHMGSHAIVWDAGRDWNGNFSANMRARITATLPAAPAPEGFALIPAGTFTMGSPGTELGRNNDETQHTVTLTRAFFLQRTEVTWEQWNAILASAVERGYNDLAIGRNGSHGYSNGQHPVTMVNWYDAIKWLNLWSELEGRTPCYTVGGSTIKSGFSLSLDCNFDANGYRLPSEAEWEYACRAGTTTAFYKGDNTGNTVDPMLDPAAWYGANSGGSTHAVGLKLANNFGVYDMHGNVREWCWDWYGVYPDGTISLPTENPVGGTSISGRVHRGGGWQQVPKECRSAHRSFDSQALLSAAIGFRPAHTSTLESP